MRRSTQGETSQHAAGSAYPASRSAMVVARARFPPALSPPMTMRSGAQPWSQQEAPGGQRIVALRGKGVLRRQAEADRQRADAGEPPDVADHAAVARDGARAIAAAMEVEQHARRVAARRERPFRGNVADPHRREGDAGLGRIDAADLVHARAALRPAGRARLRGEELPQVFDVAGHGGAPRLAEPSTAGAEGDGGVAPGMATSDGWLSERSGQAARPRPAGLSGTRRPRSACC